MSDKADMKRATMLYLNDRENWYAVSLVTLRAMIAKAQRRDETVNAALDFLAELESCREDEIPGESALETVAAVREYESGLILEGGDEARLCTVSGPDDASAGPVDHPSVVEIENVRDLWFRKYAR